MNGLIAQGQVAPVINNIDITFAQFKLLEAAGLPLNYFRTNPQFLNAFLLGNNSNSTWHGVKVEMTRRFHQGLQFQVNYTMGKALTDYDGGQNQTLGYRDNENRGLDKDFSWFDSTHVINGNFIWEVPVGRGRRLLNDSPAAVNGFLGGWQLNGIVSYASGWPFTIHSGRLNLHTRRFSTADYCCDFGIAKVTTGDQIRIISEADAQLFSNPAAGSPGQLAWRRFRSDDLFTLDLSLFKSFSLPFLGEAGELQFRFEAFNLINNVNFNVCPADQFAGVCLQNINSGNFGVIDSARDARVLQGGIKVIF